MIAGSCRSEFSGGTSRFEAVIQSQGTVRPENVIRFDVHADTPALATPGDVWLAALIVPAMYAGEPLEIHAPVSARLTRTVTEFQRLMHSWYPEMLAEVPVITPEVLPTPSHDDHGPLASFFSGGVDSWFSALRHKSQLSAIVLVKGFDIPYADTKIWPEALAGAKCSAAELGAELIAVETNLRDCVDPGLGCMKKPYQGTDFWGTCWHGTCLDAVALLLQEKFSGVVVPASWQYLRLQPWGSHPLIDALLSNGRVEIMHDGADASRMDKLRAIAKVPACLKLLRVCPDFTRGVYNCGECEKCRRTLLALRTLGVSEEGLPFSAKLDLRALELNPPKAYLRPLYREILAEAVRLGDPELIRCLRVLAGDSVSLRGEWHRWSSRMKRSVNKRLNRLRHTRKAGWRATTF